MLAACVGGGRAAAVAALDPAAGRRQVRFAAVDQPPPAARHGWLRLDGLKIAEGELIVTVEAGRVGVEGGEGLEIQLGQHPLR